MVTVSHFVWVPCSRFIECNRHSNATPSWYHRVTVSVLLILAGGQRPCFRIPSPGQVRRSHSAFQEVGVGKGLLFRCQQGHTYRIAGGPLVLPAGVVVVNHLDRCAGLSRVPNQPLQSNCDRNNRSLYGPVLEQACPVPSSLFELSRDVPSESFSSAVLSCGLPARQTHPQVAQPKLECDCPDRRGRRCTVPTGPNVESAVCSKPAHPDEVL